MIYFVFFKIIFSRDFYNFVSVIEYQSNLNLVQILNFIYYEKNIFEL